MNLILILTSPSLYQIYIKKSLISTLNSLGAELGTAHSQLVSMIFIILYRVLRLWVTRFVPGAGYLHFECLSLFRVPRV